VLFLGSFEMGFKTFQPDNDDEFSLKFLPMAVIEQTKTS